MEIIYRLAEAGDRFKGVIKQGPDVTQPMMSGYKVAVLVHLTR